MRGIRRFICVLLCVAGCGRAHLAVDRSHAVSFLALGDSYTIGQSVSPADRWPVQLAARLRARGRDVGEPAIIAQTGWVTQELSHAIDEADPVGPFGLVGLLIGVNDQFAGEPAERFRPQFVAMLDRAVAFTGGDVHKVVVISIPDWGVMPFAADQNRDAIGRSIDAYNAVVADECRRRGVVYVDVTPVSREASTQPALGANDGLHPSGAQYARWAALAEAALAARAF